VKSGKRNLYRANFGCLFVIAVVAVALSLLIYWLEQA
jgi:hypothetical protein